MRDMVGKGAMQDGELASSRSQKEWPSLVSTNTAVLTYLLYAGHSPGLSTEGT